MECGSFDKVIIEEGVEEISCGAFIGTGFFYKDLFDTSLFDLYIPSTIKVMSAYSFAFFDENHISLYYKGSDFNLILKHDDSKNWQHPTEVTDYIEKNLKRTGSIENFEIYEK